MNARDELAREIFIADNSKQSREQSIQDWERCENERRHRFRIAHYKPMADGLLAAGWTQPRIIETVEELDTLPDQSVILSRKGHSFQRDGGRWRNAALTGGCPPIFVPLPATVLWEPTA